MGMSIDDAIPIIHDMYNYYSDEMVEPYVGFDADDKQAIETALDTMRKYQKIVDIVSLNDEEFKQCSLKELKEILEVIADGNDD